MIRPTHTLLAIAMLSCWLLAGCSSSNNSTASTAEKPAMPATAETGAVPEMEKAALDLMAGLSPEQQEKALFSFDDAERKNWHFVPMVRGGLPLREMEENQREQVMKLLQTALSEQGQQKVEGIMQLERVLQELENRPYENNYRNPLLYYIALFGEPNGKDPWGWRFEGHHLSLNFSSVDRELAITPAFMGSNPAIVRSGEFEGTQVLKAEQELGRALVHMFSPDQAGRAILSDIAPKDIITAVQQKVELDEYAGLPVTEFTEAQQAKLEELLGVYLHNMKPEIAGEHWEKLQESGIDKIHFAWMGGTEPGDPHYYRIHGPTLLVEYDNVQNGNNHIHAVWRDLTNDFGEDILRAHYAHGHKHE